MNIEEHGRWLSPTEFEFNHPIELAPGVVMRRIDFSRMEMEVPPAEVVEVLLDPNRSTEIGHEEPDGGILTDEAHRYGNFKRWHDGDPEEDRD